MAQGVTAGESLAMLDRQGAALSALDGGTAGALTALAALLALLDGQAHEAPWGPEEGAPPAGEEAAPAGGRPAGGYAPRGHTGGREAGTGGGKTGREPAGGRRGTSSAGTAEEGRAHSHAGRETARRGDGPGADKTAAPAAPRRERSAGSYPVSPAPLPEGWEEAIRALGAGGEFLLVPGPAGAAEALSALPAPLPVGELPGGMGADVTIPTLPAGAGPEELFLRAEEARAGRLDGLEAPAGGETLPGEEALVPAGAGPAAPRGTQAPAAGRDTGRYPPAGGRKSPGRPGRYGLQEASWEMEKRQTCPAGGLDVDGVLRELERRLEQELAAGAEGVYR